VPESFLVFDTVAQSIKIVVNVDLRDAKTIRAPPTTRRSHASTSSWHVSRAPLRLPDALPATGEGFPSHTT
jgi:hypothetical protein